MNVVPGCVLLSAISLGVFQTQAPARAARQTFEPPRLVVMLVVDQMRADYITTYGHHWTKGLRRLIDTGATFPLARYPYAYTVTCAGHATISTGTFPATHGMIGNEWYDRGEGKTVLCTEDKSVTSVPFGGAAGVEHHGPARLTALTFADELHLNAVRPPTVLTLSLKPRTAITMAGRPAPSTYAIWQEDNGTWATSTAYAATPPPAVDRYVTGHSISSDYGHSWTRAFPSSFYLFTDKAAGELPPDEFPHVLDSKTGKPDTDFVTLWRRSPLSDRYLGELGKHLVRELKIGQTTGTDLLGVSFSALDLVGHEYGPRSHEIQDILVRLDETIGALLDALDRLVGRDRYVVALSSDHGVALVPEQDAEVVAGTGRYTSTDVRAAVNAAIESVAGPGAYVTARTGPNVYLAPGALARVLSVPGAREDVRRAVRSMQGISHVYWADELASLETTDDAILRASRLSYVRGRSGDLFVISDPYWIGQATGTTHGTPYGYDQRVPVLFAGAGIAPGRYLVPASPADIAPTLAHLAGITIAHSEGRILTAAIK